MLWTKLKKRDKSYPRHNPSDVKKSERKERRIKTHHNSKGKKRPKEISAVGLIKIRIQNNEKHCTSVSSTSKLAVFSLLFFFFLFRFTLLKQRHDDPVIHFFII